MLQFVHSRSGELSLSVEGRYIHSRYAPRKEARRYLDSISLETGTLYILLEPGLDYLAEEMYRRNPELEILSIHCLDELKGRTKNSRLSYFPSDYPSLENFLSLHVADHTLSSLEIIEWGPSVTLLEEQMHLLRNGVYDFVRRRNADLNTTGIFGSLRLKRRISAFLQLDDLVSPEPEYRPIVIAAAGPSLPSSLATVRKHRDLFAVWALSSALTPLESYGIHPDLVFHSDPGFYAGYHLRTLVESGRHTGIAAPLSAAIDDHLSAARMLLLSESRTERFLLEGQGLPYLEVPSHGTVAGTAYYTALRLARSQVYFAGLDFAFRDIQAHAAGHAFSPLLMAGAHRFEPLLSRVYSRAPLAREQSPSRIDGWIQSPALKAYSRWFAERTRGGFTRINPSPVEIPSFRSIEAEEFEREAEQLEEEAPGLTGGSHSGPGGIPPGPLDTRGGRLLELFNRIREETDAFSQIDDSATLETFLQNHPLFEEWARETNISALLRLRGAAGRGTPMAEASRELQRSLYSTCKKLETVAKRYAEQ